MLSPSLPPSEAARLALLREYEVLDTPQEEVFDNLVRLAAYIMQTPVSLVSLVDEHRQWFKARRGIDIQETPRAVSFCGHVSPMAVHWWSLMRWPIPVSTTIRWCWRIRRCVFMPVCR